MRFSITSHKIPINNSFFIKYPKFSRNKKDGVKASVQYISRAGDSVNGMISYELTNHFKKWPQMDANFMSVLGRIIFEKIFNGDEKDG